MRRTTSLGANGESALVTNALGEFAILNSQDWQDLEQGSLSPSSSRYMDLEAKGLLRPEGPSGGLANIVMRTRKSFLTEGPSLHIFVVTLRCDHSCQYCQVSRASLNAVGKDMEWPSAMAAIDRVLESDAPALTVEFQGGEPALRFDLIRKIAKEFEARNAEAGRVIRFTMATTLHLLTDDDLAFCRDQGIHLSTSIDGPEAIHSAQRVIPTRDSWTKSVEALARARSILGDDGVAALPTVTRATLQHPEDLVDAYVDLGFTSIFLRPLAPYGFARKTKLALGYPVADFIAFYERAFSYILKLNAAGVRIEETTAAIMLRHILTPFHSGYMDLRSPAGAGLGTLVYNYDGGVYPSDEARMAAETGDQRFRLGSVNQPLDDLLTSEPMRWLAKGAVAELQKDCSDCAFVPYCGADPVHHAIVNGDPATPRGGTDFCERHIGIFRYLFDLIAANDAEVMRTLLSWVFSRDRASLTPGWVER